MADVIEAIIGAIYLDGGFKTAYDFVVNHIFKLLPLTEIKTDFKSILQQKVQANRLSKPIYSIINETGPDHMKTFQVEVSIPGFLTARGTGNSKKQAEFEAAHAALIQFNAKEKN